MAETVDELTMAYEENGQLLVKELEKEVLSKGAWATVMFLFQNLNKKTGEYEAPRVAIRRYQKSGGRFNVRSKFSITGEKQARQVMEVLGKWFPEESE